jgi:hypothetical protein
MFLQEQQKHLKTCADIESEHQRLAEQRRTARQAAYQLIDGVNRFVVCGHILLEAVPGTAKPSDIFGYYDTDPTSNTLTFRQGPSQYCAD